MVLVGAAVLPHGDFAYDPTLLSVPRVGNWTAAEQLHRGSEAAGAAIASLNPDTIILVTPHGLQTSWDLAVYDNSDLRGDAIVGRDLDESFGPEFPKREYSVELDARSDIDLARGVADRLPNATLLRGWNDVLPLPLRWGEVLALGHLSMRRNATRPTLSPDVVVLGLPLSRYNLSSVVAGGFRALGHSLAAAIAAQNRRVAIIVSTDLAHTHWPNTTFGFRSEAAEFDAAVGEWAATLDEDALFGRAAAVVDEIYSCGWLGLALLHGALEASGGLGAWRPTLHAAPAHPTYYGMMASSVVPRREVERESNHITN